MRSFNYYELFSNDFFIFDNMGSRESFIYLIKETSTVSLMLLE